MLINTPAKVAAVTCSIILCALFIQPGLVHANPNANVEASVRASFSDMPDMITIAKCESGFRQFNADGSVLKGGSSGKYVGIFQIGEALHTPKAQSMAYDINTVEGNIAYARYMYFASGSNPWKSCLTGSSQPAPAVVLPSAPAPSTPTSASAPAASPVAGGSLSANLNLGMTNSQVIILQQILNKSGFAVAASGVGSPGQETNYFGSLTREAVKRFQCAKNITCSGNESTTGFGRVGPQTRAALN